ncbi:DNA starvation/stationary phase protection protein [Limibacter armeniacum]|uniref:Dps family protein n=1 Tax=Limibacter armeniacum TaxID=466084 RepID=UPI002FE637A0
MNYTENMTSKDMVKEKNADLQKDVNIGLKKPDRKRVATGLSHLLADTYALMIKTHNYHWNVTGPMFKQIHELTEEQYNEMFEAIDEIAERIRALGFIAPGSLGAFSELTQIRSGNSEWGAAEMIQDLVNSHETLVRTARGITEAASYMDDEATADLLTNRLGVHEKYIWMLRSFLK